MSLPHGFAEPGLPGQRFPVHSGPVPLLAVPADPVIAGWLQECRRHLRTDDTVDIAAVGAQVDAWMLQWHATAPTQRWNPARTLAGIGVALGDAIIAATTGTRWAVDPERRRAVVAAADGIIVAHPLDDAERIWTLGIAGQYPGTLAAYVAAITRGGQALQEPAQRSVTSRLPRLRQRQTRQSAGA